MGVDFDLATGWGTPKAGTLLPLLAGFDHGAMKFFASYDEAANSKNPDGFTVAPFAGDGFFTLCVNNLNLSLVTRTVYYEGSNSFDLVDLILNPLTGVLSGSGTAIVEGPVTNKIMRLQYSAVLSLNPDGTNHYEGKFWSIDATGKKLEQGPQPIFYGAFNN